MDSDWSFYDTGFIDFIATGCGFCHGIFHFYTYVQKGHVILVLPYRYRSGHHIYYFIGFSPLLVTLVAFMLGISVLMYDQLPVGKASGYILALLAVSVFICE